MRNKFKLYGLVSIAAAAVAAIAITTSSLSNDLLRPSADDSYTLTLNNENRWTSGQTTKDITTDSGKATVQFSYSNCSEYASGHVRLNNGGTLQNDEQITSITSFYAIYTGTGKLQIQTSYDAISWGSYFDINSESELTLNSHPYYIRLQANDGYVDLLSVRYTYSCTPTEFPVVTETSYQMVENASELMAGDEVIISMMTSESASTAYTLTNTYNSGTPWYLKSTSGSVSDGKLSYSSSMVKWTVGGTEGAYTFTADNGVNYLRSYVNDTHYNVVCQDSSYSSGTNTWSLSHVTGSGYRMSSVYSSSTIYLAFSGTNYNTFKGLTSAPSDYYVCFFKEVSSSSASTTPVDAYDFTIADNGSYNTNSVYNNDKALTVTVKYSDGTQQVVTSGYSFEVKNSSGNAIDPTSAFGETGTYTVYVTIPGIGTKSLEIGVERNLVMESISISMSQTTFTTDDTIATVLGSYLTGSITYNFTDANVTNVSYSTLSSKGLAPTLMYNSTSHSADGKFTDAGTYYLSLGNGVLSSNSITLTVNAIPVTSITVSPDTLDLTTKSGTQNLTANVLPENATDKSVTWSSSDTTVVTVSTEGVVSVVGEGTANVTATAKDGSGKSGSCSVTVTAPVQGLDEGDFTYLSEGTPEIGSYVLITSGYDDGSAYAVSKTQNTNNRAAEAVTISDHVITREESDNFVAFLVEEGTTSDTFAFYDPINEGYIYAASSSSNQLKTESTKSANSSWSISNGGSAVMTAQGTNSRNKLQYNSGSTLFSCYSSSTQKSVYLFAKGGEVIYPTAIGLSGNNEVSVGGTSELTVSYTPANTNYKKVSFETSDYTVATVSDSGVISGHKAGTATITAIAQTKDSTVSTTFAVTVKTVAVTGVSLNKTSSTLAVGDSETLTATVAPSNASNQNVTWTTSNNGVITVDEEGKVTAVSSGTATITVTTEDGNKTATCSYTVSEASAASGWLTSLTVGDEVVLCCQDATAELTSVSSIGEYTTYSTEPAATYTLTVCSGTSSGSYAFKTSSDTYLSWSSGNSLTTSSSISSNSSWTVSFDGENATILNVSDSSRQILWNVSSPRFAAYSGKSVGTSYYAVQFYGAAPATPTSPDGITVDPSSVELRAGGTKQLSIVYSPVGCNQDKGVTWISSNTAVATVDSSGNVKVSSSATAGQTATITATSTYNATFTSTCTVTVVEQPLDAWTVLMYVCGADLESDYASSNKGYATGDLKEILSVTGQPDDVNIVIETGGAKKWSSTYGISSSYLERYHVENRSLVRDAQLTKASMGEKDTLQSFIEYGLSEYPAEKTALIFWNHGGAMYGCCYDENYSDDSLTSLEVKNALSGAFSAVGRTEKLEWIGYDCCLMQVQDIAEFNSSYANYMVASEESESGAGWDYDKWVDDLYAKSSTTTILKAICDSFLAEQGSSSDQTLSYLNLSYMSAYKSAFETFATQLQNKVGTSNKSTFASWVTSNIKYYADSDYTYFLIFDAKDFVVSVGNNSSYNPGSTYVNNVLTAFDNLVEYSKAGTGAGDSNGLALVYVCSSSYASYIKSVYTTSYTNFTNWRTFNTKCGYLS